MQKLALPLKYFWSCIKDLLMLLKIIYTCVQPYEMQLYTCKIELCENQEKLEVHNNFVQLVMFLFSVWVNQHVFSHKRLINALWHLMMLNFHFGTEIFFLIWFYLELTVKQWEKSSYKYSFQNKFILILLVHLLYLFSSGPIAEIYKHEYYVKAILKSLG